MDKQVNMHSDIKTKSNVTFPFSCGLWDKVIDVLGYKKHLSFLFFLQISSYERRISFFSQIQQIVLNHTSHICQESSVVLRD